MGARIQTARRAAGLSQAALAERTGVSRQAIGAIEAGRHRPGIDAALALAGALGVCAEDLFRTHDTTSIGVLGGDDPPPGAPILSARVGRREVHAPADLAGGQERWPVADATWRDGVPRAFADATREGLVVVGCDPALALAAAQLPATGPRRLMTVNAGTRAALDALRAGRAHAALVHGRGDALPRTPDDVLRVHLARWRVGLATTQRARTMSLTALAGGGTGIVQREDGASSQQALVRALAAAGCPRPSGPRARGHLAVALRVLAGARAGVTMEPAAVHSGLSFLPLEEHVVQLWVAGEHRDHSGVQALGDVLRSATFHARLGAIGGYDLAGCGATVGEGR